MVREKVADDGEDAQDIKMFGNESCAQFQRAN
jgi:hypothetical protein